MNLKQIQAFLTVARTLSFTRASEELFLSQQNISVLINNLETELGFLLFDRRRNGLGLTNEGRYLNNLFSNELQAGNRLRDEIDLDKRRREQNFRFGYSVWIDPFGQIDRALTVFRSENPGLGFTGRQDNNDMLFRMLQDNELDAAIIPAGQVLGDKAFDYFPFAREEICLCVPDDITDEEIDPECWGLTMLTAASWNWGPFEWKRILNQEMADLGLTPRSVRILPSVQSMIAQLETCRCAAILDKRFGLGSKVPGVRFIPLKLKNVSMCACVRHRDNESPVTERFARFLTEFFDE